MLTLIGEVVIELVFVAAVIVAVSCLAYLLSLTVREHRELKAAVYTRSDSESERAPANAEPARSLRLGIARHHATPSG
jgi:hypothetical protein